MRTAGQGYGAGDASRRKYADMENDDATGLLHTLWRQYDSYSARWTAPDPYGGSIMVADPQSFNRYAYVNGDPMNHVDPLGLMLSDMGIYQTEDPEQAKLAEHQSLRDLQKSVNDDYTRRHQVPTHINALHEAGHMAGDQTKSTTATVQRKVLDQDPAMIGLPTPEIVEAPGDVIVNVTGWYPHQPENVTADCRIRAMLDTIAYSEGADYGTVVHGTVIRAPSHPELVGRRNVTVTDFSDHPNALVRVGPTLTSTAAGRYQFLHRTWTSLGLPDFTPRSQDQGAITLMRRRGMIGPLMSGDVQTAITNGNREWASLPGSPYGQGTRSMNRLVSVYNNALQRCTQ
jgi:RHS repeat-associated protein